MPLGGLRGSTPMPSPLVPQAYASYDPVTRRKVRFIETIVPALSLADSTMGSFILADRYYCKLGALSSAAAIPQWLAGVTGSGTFQQWSSPNLYMEGGELFGSTPLLAWYDGPMGQAPDHSPKNSSVSMFILEFRAAFPDAADYTVRGIGVSTITTSADFAAAQHCIFVSKDATPDWVLGSADGSTLSEEVGGTADTAMHDFKVVWTSADIKLYVDGTLTVTKTTNRPTQPMRIHTRGTAGTHDLRIVDINMRWE
jgi:hypothetical protein